MSQPLPNFLHLGPSKSGSTWLHEVLIRHPEIYLTAAKDLYFFSRYYDRGLAWYGAQFRSVQPEHVVVGEVCQDYLSCPEAPERILDCLGSDVRLMVTLREPVSRAFSSYLYLRKHGQAAATFRDTAATWPDVIGQSRYATHLRSYLRFFDRKAVHISVFDDLAEDPQAFLDDVTDWLAVSRQMITSQQLEAQLPASTARWLPLARTAKQAANWVRNRDGAELVGRIKRSPLIQRTLYRPLGAGRPAMSPEDIAFAREQLEGEVAGVEEEFGIELRQRWNWE